MKKFFSLLTFIVLLNTASSQNWQWAKHYGGSNGYNGAGQLCLDLSGNVYFTGGFSSPYGIFESDTFNTWNATAKIFILKTDNSGNLIWVKTAGGTGLNNASGGGDIKYDPVTSSIYTTGYIQNSNALPSCIMPGFDGNIYLARLDTSGNCVWGVLLGGVSNNTQGGAIALDENGNVYILGMLVTNGSIDTFSVTAGSFIAKYDSNGTCLFAKNICSDSTYAVQIKYSNSKLFITGASLNDTIVIDTSSALSHGSYDGFIAALDSVGNSLWVKAIGGPDDDGVSAFDIDGDGNLYLSGAFKDTAYVDSIQLINSSNNYWFYFSKWSINGNTLWANEIPTDIIPSIFFPTDIRNVYTDVNGYSYLTGSFNDTMDFGGGHVVTTTDSMDTFIARYDSSGNCLGALNFGVAQGGAIASDAGGAYYTAGLFAGTVQLGSTTLNSYSSTVGDIYLAKHDAITGEEEAPRLAYSNSLHIYANPNEGKCTITIPDDFKHENNLTLQIFDVTGKLLQRTQLEMTEGKIKLNIEAQAKGVYNAVLSNGRKNYSGRIVFE
jgi:hypothetical protein